MAQAFGAAGPAGLHPARRLILTTYRTSTKVLLVLLRIAIGWHLCYEGLHKLRTHAEGEKPFSSEMYLRNSSGPFQEHFQGLVDDFHGTDLMDEEKIQDVWDGMIVQYDAVWKFPQKEMEQIHAKRDELLHSAKAYLKDPKTQTKVKEYRQKAKHWDEHADSTKPRTLDEAHRQLQRELDQTRREILGPLLGWQEELRKHVESLRQEELGAMTRWRVWWSTTTRNQKVDTLVMWGLTILGALLMAGLFSRFSAVMAAGLLLLFYIAMPPWPGLPVPPNAEGNYLFVNKNLIEILALLMLATTPSGVWGGLDALIRGMITRPVFGTGARELAESTPAASSSASSSRSRRRSR